MRFCLDRRVLFGLGAVALAVLVFAPSAFGRALPVLLVAACPLSMLLMMGAMSGGRSKETEDGPSDRPDEPVSVESLRHELSALRSREATVEAELDALGEGASQVSTAPDVTD